MALRAPKGASEVCEDGSLIKTVKPRAAGSAYVSLPVDWIGRQVKIFPMD